MTICRQRKASGPLSTRAAPLGGKPKNVFNQPLAAARLDYIVRHQVKGVIPEGFTAVDLAEDLSDNLNVIPFLCLY